MTTSFGEFGALASNTITIGVSAIAKGMGQYAVAWEPLMVVFLF